MDISQVIAEIPQEYLEKPVTVECVFDRWCAWGAVGFLCGIVGVPTSVTKRFPTWVPAGSTAESPYGITGIECPYPILGKGTGLEPRHRIEVGWTLRTALQSLGEGI